MYVSVGELKDGTNRWYVEVTRAGARAYPTEVYACAVVRNWMRTRDGDWEQVPCYPTQGWQEGERA